MKIGIMSMQRIINYGSYLQAYGLKKLIEELGYEVEFVDFRPGDNLVENKKYKNTILYKSIRNIWKKIKKEVYLVKKNKTIYEKYWDDFENIYMKELGVFDKKQYGTKVDILIIGSDEVFNCTQSASNIGFSKELFGANNNASKVITYAASFGNTTIEKLERYSIVEEVAGLLRNFQALSVRDKNSYNIVKQLVNIEPLIHLDPVLIYDYTNDLKDDVSLSDYIVVYAYNGRISNEECQWIEKFAELKNKKIVTISGRQNIKSQYVYGHPLKILAYFKHADYIITDTFHGTIFSIINQKPFVTMVRDDQRGGYGNKEKLSYLLERLELSERKIENMEELDSFFKKSIDYEHVNKIIEQERIRTRKYLRNELVLVK